IVLLVSYTSYRTFDPIRYTGDTASLLAVLGEVGLFTLLVVATDLWASPLLVSLVSAVMVAGFARGFGFAIRISLVAALAIGLSDLQRPDFSFETDAREGLQWTVILLMVAVIAGYARRISGEADRQHSLALDRLGR